MQCHAGNAWHTHSGPAGTTTHKRAVAAASQCARPQHSAHLAAALLPLPLPRMPPLPLLGAGTKPGRGATAAGAWHRAAAAAGWLVLTAARCCAAAASMAASGCVGRLNGAGRRKSRWAAPRAWRGLAEHRGVASLLQVGGLCVLINDRAQAMRADALGGEESEASISGPLHHPQSQTPGRRLRCYLAHQLPHTPPGTAGCGGCASQHNMQAVTAARPLVAAPALCRTQLSSVKAFRAVSRGMRQQTGAS